MTKTDLKLMLLGICFATGSATIRYDSIAAAYTVLGIGILLAVYGFFQQN